MHHFQCTRHWFWTEHDQRRRQGLAGPELLEKKEAVARAARKAERAAARIAQGLPPEFDAVGESLPGGARCCDRLVFGPRAQEEAAAGRRMRGGHSERAGLLGGSTGQ